MKKFYTSYYAKHGKDPNAVSISVRVPRWYPKLTHYSPLAPTWEMVKKIKADGDQQSYTEAFSEILQRLDPAKVVNDLPDGAILLCYEKPSDFCHRHLVRDWLNASGLAEVEEISWMSSVEKLLGG